MANPEHPAIVKHGAEVWNRWRQERFLADFDADLSGAQLRGARLSGVALAAQT
jgi:hypothetical protein